MLVSEDDAAKLAIVRVFQQVAVEYQQSLDCTKALNDMLAAQAQTMAAISARANDCYAAARALNFDLIAALAVFQQQQLAQPQPQQQTVPDPIAAPQPAQQVIAPAKPIRDMVLEMAQAAYPQPVHAATLQKEIENLRSTKLHFKTIGMSLYRLSREGLMVRRGQKDWFFVPPEQWTKNPDVGASGQEDFGL